MNLRLFIFFWGGITGGSYLRNTEYGIKSDPAGNPGISSSRKPGNLYVAQLLSLALYVAQMKRAFWTDGNRI